MRRRSYVTRKRDPTTRPGSRTGGHADAHGPPTARQHAPTPTGVTLHRTRTTVDATVHTIHTRTLPEVLSSLAILCTPTSPSARRSWMACGSAAACPATNTQTHSENHSRVSSALCPRFAGWSGQPRPSYRRPKPLAICMRSRTSFTHVSRTCMEEVFKCKIVVSAQTSVHDGSLPTAALAATKLV